MRARRAIVPTILLLLLPSPARAKYGFQGIVTLSGGYTSNASGASADTPSTPTEGDILFLVTPSVVFTSALPRALQRVAYTFSTTLYANHSELDTLSNRLEWSGFFTPSRTTDLLISAYGAQTQLNTVDVITLDTGAAVPNTITRPGTQSFWSAGLLESFVWNWSDVSRLKQGASFTAFIPTTAGIGQSYIANVSLGLERRFPRDAVSGDLQLGYTYYQEQRGPVTNPDGTVNPDGVVIPVRQQIDGNLLFHWKHDYGHFWNTDLFAGVLTVFRADDGGGQIWQPAGGLNIFENHPKFQFNIGYSHGAAPNALVQATFISDTAHGHFVVPFGVKSNLAFHGGAVYTHSQIADSNTGNLGGDINAFFVDGALEWHPLASLNIFTRYTYQNQLGDSSQSPAILPIERHVLLMGLSGTYPVDAAAAVPLGRGVRVDATDAAAIPDVHSPPAK